MFCIIDHPFARLPRDRLQQALNKFRAAGFQVEDGLVEHEHGRASGIVSLTGTYLELFCERDAEVPARTERTPRFADEMSIGMAVADVAEARRALLHANFRVPPEEIHHIGGNPDGPVGWRVLRLPASASPGARLVLVEYVCRSGTWARQRQGPNAVYGLGGITLISNQATADIEVWLRLFSVLMPGAERRSDGIGFGMQQVCWIQSGRDEHAAQSGCREGFGACVTQVNLLSSSLTTTINAMTAAGWVVAQESNGWISTTRDELTGYAFRIEAGSGPETFAAHINAQLCAPAA